MYISVIKWVILKKFGFIKWFLFEIICIVYKLILKKIVYKKVNDDV